MSYRPLACSNTRPPAVVPRRAVPDLPALTTDEPDLATMADSARECPVAVSPDRHIDDALQDMLRAGVRALLVLEEGRVLDLITYYDIQGERPIQSLQSPACLHDSCLHRDVRVADIMTPLGNCRHLSCALCSWPASASCLKRSRGRNRPTSLWSSRVRMRRALYAG